MRLSVFAQHVAAIMLDPAPTKFSLHTFTALDVEVRIEPAKNLEGHVWDNVYINGRWCGNRCGGVAEYVKMVNAAAPTVEYS